MTFKVTSIEVIPSNSLTVGSSAEVFVSGCLITTLSLSVCLVPATSTCPPNELTSARVPSPQTARPHHSVQAPGTPTLLTYLRLFGS